jgi:hypothetical protein
LHEYLEPTREELPMRLYSYGNNSCNLTIKTTE